MLEVALLVRHIELGGPFVPLTLDNDRILMGNVPIVSSSASVLLFHDAMDVAATVRIAAAAGWLRVYLQPVAATLTKNNFLWLATFGPKIEIDFVA